jgi:hypothetical protein
MKPFDIKQSGVRSMTSSKPQSQAETEGELEGHVQPEGLSSSKGQGQPQPSGQLPHQAEAQAQADALARARLHEQPQFQAPSQKQAQATAHTQPATQSNPAAQPQAATKSKPTVKPQPTAQSKPTVQSQAAVQSNPAAQHTPQLTLKLLRDIFDERDGNVDILSSDLDGIRKELQPFNSWKDRGVMLKDYRRETKYVDELVNLAKPVKNARNQLRMVALAAKNRAEAISDKSDFYPASIALLTSIFAMLVIFSFENEYIKLAFAILTPIFAFIFVSIRINTRRQVANLKIVGNILDAVEKQIPEPPKKPAVQKGGNQGRARRRWLCAPISTIAKAKPIKPQLRRKSRS